MFSANRHYKNTHSNKSLLLSYLILLSVLLLFSTLSLAKDLVLPNGVSYPEGIAFADDGTMYVGSVYDGTIVRLLPGANSMDIFSVNQFKHGAFGMVVDNERSILWVCDAIPAFDNTIITTSTLVGLSMLDGSTVYRHPLDPVPGLSVLCNDVIVHQDSLLMTETIGGRVLRVPAEKVDSDSTAEDWIIDSALLGGSIPFGANGLEIVADYLYVANSGQGSLTQYPLTIKNCLSGGCGKKVKLMDLKGKPTVFVGAVDGLAAVGRHGLLAVDNGLLLQDSSKANTLNAIFIDHRNAIGYMHVLRRYDYPTTVALNSKKVAWVVEGQLNLLFGFDVGEPNTPFKVVGESLFELLTNRH